MRSKRSRTPYPSVPSMPLIPSRSARSWSKARCRSPRCSGSEVSTIYPQQLSLDLRGRRDGAGRKPGPNALVRHRSRPIFASRTAARCAHSTRVDRPRFFGSLVRRLEEGAIRRCDRRPLCSIPSHLAPRCRLEETRVARSAGSAWRRWCLSCIGAVPKTRRCPSGATLPRQDHAADLPKRLTARARALPASTSRSRGGAVVTSESRSL